MLGAPRRRSHAHPLAAAACAAAVLAHPAASRAAAPELTELHVRIGTELIALPLADRLSRRVLYALDAELQLEVRAGEHLRLWAVPRLRWDPADPDRNRYLPEEAWLEATAGPLDTRAGLLQFDWGNGELHRPTNALNPVDYGSGMFRSRRLGELGLWARLWASERTSVEATWIPVFQHPRFPADADEVGVRLGGFTGLGVELERGFAFDRASAHFMTFAGRARWEGPIVQLEASVVSGPERMPGPWIDDVTLRGFPYVADRLGAAAAWQHAPLVVRAEGAWISTARARRKIVDENPAPWHEVVPDDYGAWVAGVELQRLPTVAGHDVSFTVEYLGEVRSHVDAQSAFRPWQADAYAAAHYLFNDANDTRVDLGTVVDVRYGDALVRASVARHLGFDVSAQLDVLVLAKGSGGPVSVLRQLEDQDSVGLRLVWER